MDSEEFRAKLQAHAEECDEWEAEQFYLMHGYNHETKCAGCKNCSRLWREKHPHLVRSLEETYVQTS